MTLVYACFTGEIPKPKSIGECIDFIVRDFVMSWFNINAEGYGISNDPAFLELVQTVLTNMIGQLFFRFGHLKVLTFILDDATEALRQHVRQYADMRQRAAEQHPDLFADLGEEALLERGRRRIGPAVPSATSLSSQSPPGDKALSDESLFIFLLSS